MCCFVFFFKKRNYLCSLAAEQRVLRREPRAGAAEASVFKPSPKFSLANACSPRSAPSSAASPCSRISSFFPPPLPVLSRDLRFLAEAATGQSLAGKNPICRGGTPRGCCADEGAGGRMGRLRAGAIPAGHRERSGNDGGLGFGTVRPAGQTALCAMQPGAGAPAKCFTSPSDLRKSPPAFARSSAGGWSTWRGEGQGKEDFLQHQAGLLTQIAKKTLE